jgi:hypothetical protein
MKLSRIASELPASKELSSALKGPPDEARGSRIDHSYLASSVASLNVLQPGLHEELNSAKRMNQKFDSAKLKKASDPPESSPEIEPRHPTSKYRVRNA